LSYAFSKKNKHNSRINISVNVKTVINSPEVCFGTKKNSILKLVAKIYLCLATKIIYADSAEMENNFYKNIYIITLCNVWHRS
jgi:hypothetical protein